MKSSLYNWVGNIIPYITQPTKGPFFIAQATSNKEKHTHNKYSSPPRDAIRDPTNDPIPYLEVRNFHHLKGHLNCDHPKKVTIAELPGPCFFLLRTLNQQKINNMFSGSWGHIIFIAYFFRHTDVVDDRSSDEICESPKGHFVLLAFFQVLNMSAVQVVSKDNTYE